MAEHSLERHKAPLADSNDYKRNYLVCGVGGQRIINSSSTTNNNNNKNNSSGNNDCATSRNWRHVLNMQLLLFPRQTDSSSLGIGPRHDHSLKRQPRPRPRPLPLPRLWQPPVAYWQQWPYYSSLSFLATRPICYH